MTERLVLLDRKDQWEQQDLKDPQEMTERLVLLDRKDQWD